MSAISVLLERILSARYGEEVRGSIHDAIEECYDDVSTAKTIADDSASAASDAATRANAAAGAAETAVEEIDDIVVVDEEEPVSETTKLWFDPSANGVAVPTCDEFGLTLVSGDDYELTVPEGVI